MKFNSVLLLILTLLASSAFAQPTPAPVETKSWGSGWQEVGRWHEVQQATQPVADAARNVVEVHFPSGGGSLNKGSGVYLGERLIATAYHVPRGTSGNGYVTFRDGLRVNCRTIQTDKIWDQAILEIEREHPSLPGVELADMNPRAGEMVYSSGFGQGFRIFGGRMTGEWASPGGTPTTDWFDHENPAIPGDSGGPIFNEAGKLIGCLWGSDGRHTVGTGTGRFNVFVKPLFPRLSAWRANRIAGQIAGIGYCPPGGQCPPVQGGSGGVPTYPGGGTPTPPTPPLPPTPSQQPQCNCDEQVILDTIIERIASDDRFRGPVGPAGPKGEAGSDGEVTAEHLAAITESLLVAIRSDEAFRGPRGERGPAGEAAQLDVDKLAQQILSRVKHPPQRVMLVDGKTGRVIDDETYQPGEPIVLDFQQILRNARQ